MKAVKKIVYFSIFQGIRKLTHSYIFFLIKQRKKGQIDGWRHRRETDIANFSCPFQSKLTWKNKTSNETSFRRIKDKKS